MFTREQLDWTGSGRAGRAAGRVCPSAESRMDVGLEVCRTDWTGTFSNFFKKMDIGIRGKKRVNKGLGKVARPARPRPTQPNKHAGLSGRVCPSGCPSAARPLPVRGGVAL